MIELYHGTNVEIDRIDLSKGRTGKDFGKGFYMNTDRKQAEAMARTVTKRESTGKPVVNTFLFDESCLKNKDLKIKIFKTYSKEWAEFVLLNRQNDTDVQKHDYDIIYGPIADDKVGYQIDNLIKGLRTINEFIKSLKFASPTFQFFFGTEKALVFLNKKQKSQKEAETEYLIDCRTQDLAKAVMNDTGCDEYTALRDIYNSSTYGKLCDTDTGLFYQSPVYINEIYKEEKRKKAERRHKKRKGLSI